MFSYFPHLVRHIYFFNLFGHFRYSFYIFSILKDSISMILFKVFSYIYVKTDITHHIYTILDLETNKKELLVYCFIFAYFCFNTKFSYGNIPLYYI